MRYNLYSEDNARVLYLCMCLNLSSEDNARVLYEFDPHPAVQFADGTVMAEVWLPAETTDISSANDPSLFVGWMQIFHPEGLKENMRNIILEARLISIIIAQILLSKILTNHIS